jgi:hypothetical protein
MQALPEEVQEIPRTMVIKGVTLLQRQDDDFLLHGSQRPIQSTVVEFD